MDDTDARCTAATRARRSVGHFREIVSAVIGRRENERYSLLHHMSRIRAAVHVPRPAEFVVADARNTKSSGATTWLATSRRARRANVGGGAVATGGHD